MMIMKKTISLLLAAVLLLSCLVSCTPTEKSNVQSRTVSYVYFNTVTVISEYAGADPEVFEGYINEADNLLGYYHKLFDIYYEYSGVNNIKTINDNAGVSPVKVDKELVDFLIYCKELFTLTNSKTNIMMGSVLKIWHDIREDNENISAEGTPLLPENTSLIEANLHTSIDSLVINENECTVYISDPKASIDVGAVGKGYAVEKLYEHLKALGANHMALNVGGNIRTIGLNVGEKMWVTGITNPDKSSDEPYACRVQIGETALVTSGDYERYFIADGVKYHHIIDPETLMPARYFTSISIFTPNSALADALSTALFCMSYEEGLALVNKIGNIEVIWIDTDYNVKMTPGVKIAE